MSLAEKEGRVHRLLMQVQVLEETLKGKEEVSAAYLWVYVRV